MRSRSLPCLLLLLLLSIALLCGCSAEPQEDTAAAEYLAAIATLQDELQQQREDFYIKETAYQTEINSLREQIATLTGEIKGEDATRTLLRYRTENGEAIITGYTGGATLLSIPDALDGYPVVGIGERAFEGTDLAAVVLPEGIREIGWFAFYRCEKLVNVTLPQSVSSIGYAVFDGCEQLCIFCPADSYSEQYARSYGIEYVTN